MMNCDQAKALLHAYLDDELDLASAAQLEAHLPGCENCRNELNAAKAIRTALETPLVYHRAPAMLRARVTRAIREEANPRNGNWWTKSKSFGSLAAAILLIIGSSLFFFLRTPSNVQIAELVDSHLRSLEADHLVDVRSTDQHTVKPWFAGKMDFSPPVVDLSVEGFPLIGGRVEYINQKKVAAIVYGRNKHTINLFIWPGDESASTDSRQGFNLIRFECKGMVCWAVSDLNAAELQQFADLFKQQKPASTRF